MTHKHPAGEMLDKRVEFLLGFHGDKYIVVGIVLDESADAMFLNRLCLPSIDSIEIGGECA